MKKIILLLAVAATASGLPVASAAESCAAKRAALEKEIRFADQYENRGKSDGLKKALAEVNAHCTQDSVVADAQRDIKNLEEKKEDKQKSIRDTEADLREAQARGNQQKVAKYQRKLTEKQAELREIQQNLDKARQDLTTLQ